jgi:hypothetical protein
MQPNQIQTLGRRYRPSSLLWIALSVVLAVNAALAQSLGSYGSLRGSILDPSNAAIPSAKMTLSNPLTGVQRTVSADSGGAYQLNGIPFGSYRLSVLMEGFEQSRQTVAIESLVPMELNITLALAGASTAVEVSGGAAGLELSPTTHGTWTDPHSIALPCKTRLPVSAKWLLE